MRSLYDLPVLFVDSTDDFFCIRWRNDELELEVDLAVILAFGTESGCGGFQTKGAVRMQPSRMSSLPPPYMPYPTINFPDIKGGFP
jgi:hypothetical protein